MRNAISRMIHRRRNGGAFQENQTIDTLVVRILARLNGGSHVIEYRWMMLVVVGEGEWRREWFYLGTLLE